MKEVRAKRVKQTFFFFEEEKKNYRLFDISILFECQWEMECFFLC